MSRRAADIPPKAARRTEQKSPAAAPRLTLPRFHFSTGRARAFQNVHQEIAQTRRAAAQRARADQAEAFSIRDALRRAAADITEQRRQEREGDREQRRQMREAAGALKRDDRQRRRRRRRVFFCKM